jgi:hypothetical protein
MAKAYHYLEVEDLPRIDVGKTLASEHQLAIPGGVGDNTACTTLERLGLAEDDVFDKYLVTHQVERDVDGIYNQKPMRRYLEIRKFAAFHHRTAGYMLVESAKEDARGAFRRLKKSQPPVETCHATVDLARLQLMGETTGGWFGKLKIADVNAAGLFGTSLVSESQEWQRYAEDGELNALLMKVVDDGGGQRSLMVTRDRLILLYRDFGEADNLRYVRYLQDTIDNALRQADAADADD